MASAVLLAAVRRDAPVVAAPVAPAEGAAVDPNPIGALQELAQKQRLRSPAYVVEQV